MALAIELKRRLEDDETPMPKRIRMAEDIFKSNQFPLKSHRDIILNWFCGLDNNEVNDSCWIDSVKKCFESTFPYSSLDSSLIENLIEITLKKNISSSIEIADVLICIVNNFSMQKYFASNLPLLSNVILYITSNFVGLCNNDNKEILQIILKKTITCLLNYNKHIKDKSLFHENVLKPAVLNIIEALDLFQDEALNNECGNLMQHTIFNKDNNCIEQYIDILKNIKRQQCIEFIFSMLSIAFIRANKDTSNVFILFKKIIEIKELFYQHQFLNAVRKENVSLDIEHENETFMAFLQKHVMVILSNDCLKENALSLLNSIIELNPLIIEPHIIETLIKVMLLKKENQKSLEEFVVFLKNVLKALLKLNRIHKLPLLLLNDMDTVMKKKCSLEGYFNPENVNIEHIWPVEAAKFWGNFMEGVNASITWGTFQSLLYNLDNKGVLDVNIDLNSGCLMTQIILRFISNFLENCKLPLMTKENFFKLRDNSRKAFEILAKIAPIIMKKQLNSLLVHWMETVFIVDEFTIMLKYYWDCMDSHLELPLIEHYFDVKSWKKLRKFIGQSDCQKSQDYMSNICLQHIRYNIINAKECDIKAELNTSFDYILENWKVFLHSKVLFKTLIPLMSNSQIVTLLNNSMNEIITPINLPILRLEYIQENKKFILISLYSIFYDIGKWFSLPEGNKTFTDNIIQFDITELLSNKQNCLKMIGETLEDNIIVLHNSDIEKLENLLNALIVLNLQYLDNLDKSYTYIFITCVLGNLEEMIKSDESIDNSYQKLANRCCNLCETILLCILETGPSLSIDEYISPTVYVKFCTWISTPEPIQLLIEMSIKENSNMILKLVKSIKKISKKCNVLADYNCPNTLSELLILPIVCLTNVPKMKKLHRDLKPTILELRNKCSDIIYGLISKSFRNATPECISILLPGYNHLLQYWINSVEIRNEIADVLIALPTFLNYSIENIQTSARGDSQFLITLVIRNQKYFAEQLPNNFVLNMWHIYYKTNCNMHNISSTENVLNLLENCNDKDFEDIVVKLNENTLKLKVDCIEFQNTIKLWENITGAVLSGNKSKLRLEILRRLCQDLLTLIVEDKTMDKMTSLIIFKFFLTAINNPLVQINFLIIETILSAVLLMPFEHMTISEVELFKVCSEIVNFILLKRTALILDRLPVVALCIRYLIKALCKWSAFKNENNLQEDNTQIVLADLGHHIEKIFSALIKLKKDVSRPAYFMHDLIAELTSYTLTNKVKQSLLNCCYQIHSLCDPHALKFINTVSSPANREIFKNIHETYNKFYMFKGKI